MQWVDRRAEAIRVRYRAWRRRGGPPGDPATREQRLRRKLRKARTRARVLREQRDAAVNALQSSRPDLGYLFVVAYGRSGSTLLAGILSSIPGYLIRGENAQAAYHLYKFHQALAEGRARHAQSSLRPGDPWVGIAGYDEELAKEHVRQLMLATVLRPEPATRVVGYKEIRWWQEDGLDFLRFLAAVFPGARFVFNTRDHQQVARSKWWNNAVDPLGTLRRRQSQMDEMRRLLGERAFHVHYDDYTADPTSLRPLFDWLGEPFDEQRIRAVMSRRHSY